MSRPVYQYLIGKLVKFEQEVGVITRVDLERGLVYVLFDKMNEQKFAYPESIDQQQLVLLDVKTIKR